MDSSDKTLLIGAGGHGRVLIDICRLSPNVRLVGISDPQLQIGADVMGIPVFGGDDWLVSAKADGFGQVIIGVGQITYSMRRSELFAHCSELGYSLPNVIHPQTVLASDITLGQGVQIVAGVIINPNARIGDNVVLNTACRIEHDVSIASHCFVSPGAILCGGVTLEAGCFIGAGAIVLQGVTIQAGAVVGAGSVVTRDVPSRRTVVGCPARLIERN